MNLALRRATKAGAIDAATHDAVMGHFPKPPNGDGPPSLFGQMALQAWGRLGHPVSGGLALVDRRPELYGPREAWLAANCPPMIDPEAFRMVWAALDADTWDRAMEKSKAKEH